jgi:hypothetical protein
MKVFSQRSQPALALVVSNIAGVWLDLMPASRTGPQQLKRNFNSSP